MASRDEIVAYLDRELEIGRYRDYGPIGLQVIGADEVRRVATAVSASLDVFERAGALGADLLVVHHGLFWDGAPRVIGRLERRRLEALFRHDLSLVAYHLPLDAHAELGNNAGLMALLGIAAHEPFAIHRGTALGRHGTLAEPATAEALAGMLGAAIGSAPIAFAGCPGPIRTVGAVSGAAAGDVRAAAALGLDCLVTGEPEEETPYLAAELGVTVIAAGHNATETLGVRAVGARLEQVFGLATEFLAVENPV